MIDNLVRNNIKKLKPYTCARDLYNDGILLDANENSFGSTFQELEELHLNRYPDPHQVDLRNAVSKLLNVDANKLFFGVGSDEIIDLLIRIFCEPKENQVMLLEPTYGMYKVACDINNVETVAPLLNNSFQIDFAEVEKHYSAKVKIIFVCSPNNPTGNLLKKEDILQLCRTYKSIVVVDEAYIDFSEPTASLIDEVKNYRNLVVMRTFSKAWGLAGVRLGFCAANEEIISYLFKVKAPYNINALTGYAVLKSIANEKKKKSAVSAIISERLRVENELKDISAITNVYPSDANYLLIRLPNAKEIQKELAEKGIVIRDRSSQPKLDNCLRITIGTKEENDALLSGLKILLQKKEVK
ncbi:MAG: histidinol-phosphate transaminase [Ignavibacteriaceae bacterium]|nr:histidinol-phosphate transaminase [Ignavibacteriaceae bacterium]